MRYLFLLRQSPYGNSLAREALDMALASAAFDQQVQLVFMDDGIYQLIPNHDTSAIGRKNISKTLDALPLYDISDIYVDLPSLEKYGIKPESLSGNLTLASTSDISRLIREADKVMVF